MARIIESGNYGKFRRDIHNRSVGHNKSLKASMEVWGWLDAYPMHVYEDKNGDLCIKDGHNRFHYAKELGIPVKYVVDHDVDLVDLQSTQSKWSLKDYLTCFCSHGNKHYITLREYCAQYKFPFTSAICIMMGSTCNSGNLVNVFRRGEFKIKRDMEVMHRIGEASAAISAARPDIAMRETLCMATTRVYDTGKIDHNRMMKQISKYAASLMVPVVKSDQYVDMIEKVYNYRSREKRSIALTVRERMDEARCRGYGDRESGI